MVCPQCGYDMGNKSKCLRCGYEVKTLVTVDETRKKDEDETKVIDPADVFISNGYDDFDDSFGDPFDPFSMLFGNVFDPIGDLLGGLFGLDVRTSRSTRNSRIVEPENEPKRKKQGKVVEVNNVEFLDENGNPINNTKKTKKSNGNKSKDKK
ncbi:MAG: hypothetical protein K2M48_01395 [Clostridiales bacterium]|nr:hypothetical protein [Clostridiales bacterium]